MFKGYKIESVNKSGSYKYQITRDLKGLKKKNKKKAKKVAEKSKKGCMFAAAKKGSIFLVCPHPSGEMSERIEGCKVHIKYVLKEFEKGR